MLSKIQFRFASFYIATAALFTRDLDYVDSKNKNFDEIYYSYKCKKIQCDFGSALWR